MKEGSRHEPTSMSMERNKVFFFRGSIYNSWRSTVPCNSCTDIVIFSFPPFYPRYTCKFLPKIIGDKTSHKELRVLRQTAASEKQRHEEAEVFFGRAETGGSRLGPGNSLLFNWWWNFYAFLLICSLKVGFNYQEFPGSRWTNEYTYRHDMNTLDHMTYLLMVQKSGEQNTCYTWNQYGKHDITWEISQWCRISEPSRVCRSSHKPQFSKHLWKIEA